jgi:hypothetical protein
VGAERPSEQAARLLVLMVTGAMAFGSSKKYDVFSLRMCRYSRHRRHQQQAEDNRSCEHPQSAQTSNESFGLHDA